jgi:integrase
VHAALHTGLRKSELSSLTWGCVDMRNRLITVESAYAKNHETRSVPLTNDLHSALQNLQSERSPQPSDRVFINRYGKPWRSWRTAFSNATEKAELTDFRFHDLRHTYGSWLAMESVIAESRMALMGHRAPAMTLRYTHLDMNYKREAVARLPALSETESPQISRSRESGNLTEAAN